MCMKDKDEKCGEGEALCGGKREGLSQRGVTALDAISALQKAHDSESSLFLSPDHMLC